MIDKVSSGLAIVIFLIFSAIMIQAQDKFLTIPASDFRPYDESVNHSSDYDYSFLESGTGVTLLAPIYLPQNANIKSVTLSYTDSSWYGNMEFYVMRTNLYTHNSQQLFSGATSGDSGSGTITDSSIDGGSRIVKNNSFQYTAYIYIDNAEDGSQLRWYGLKIKYQ